MKGLNCYARFYEVPGIEKLTDHDQVKQSFLAPVTPIFSQREPFRRRAVAGLFQCVLHTGFLLEPYGLFPSTGHCCFLRRSHCSQWPVPVLQLDGKNPYSGRPLIFSLFAFSPNVVGFLGVGFPRYRASEPTTIFFRNLLHKEIP